MTDEEALAAIETLFGDLPTLETERLIMRKVARGDAEDIYAWASDEAVVKYLPLPRVATPADAERLVEQFVSLIEAKRVTQWAVVEKASQTVIGLCGFENWGIMSDRGEMGFMFGRSRWRKGFAYEAVEATLAFGFQEMKLNRIEGRTKPENEPAQRLMASLGMTCEGLLRQNIHWKGSYHDLYMYSMLRGDPAARPYLIPATDGKQNTLAGRLHRLRTQEPV